MTKTVAIENKLVVARGHGMSLGEGVNTEK